MNKWILTKKQCYIFHGTIKSSVYLYRFFKYLKSNFFFFTKKNLAAFLYAWLASLCDDGGAAGLDAGCFGCCCEGSGSGSELCGDCCGADCVCCWKASKEFSSTSRPSSAAARFRSLWTFKEEEGTAGEVSRGRNWEESEKQCRLEKKKERLKKEVT